MDIIFIIFCAVLSLLFLYILSTMCRKGHKGLQELRGWAYAHRGLHGDGVPENSLAAFKNAVDAGYGSELDVHLLADGELAVIHDSLLLRTTGMDGRVEDLTKGDLKKCFLEETTEVIPTLEQVLDVYDGKAPLIIEIKPVGNNYAALCECVCAALERYSGVYCIESFDPRCVYWFKKHRPDIIRGQLAANFFRSKSSRYPAVVKFAMKAQLLNFLTRPDFVAYKFCDRKNFGNFLCRNIWGAQGVTWTLCDQQEYDIAVKENWIPIFEGFRP